ncbi:plastid acetyl-CoA carboxylase, partial [Tanacetum coccineum]
MNLGGIRKEKKLRPCGVQRNQKKKPKKVWGLVLGGKKVITGNEGNDDVPTVAQDNWAEESEKVCDVEVAKIRSRRQLHFLGRDMKTSSLLEVHLDWTYYEESYAVENAQFFGYVNIIEEEPITVVPQETIKELEQAARRLAKLVDYVGAATVEYLYSMETGDYYLLELNPRLQVEHPVTEWIAQINLPATQVAVGMGIPLWQTPEIRWFYGMDNSGGYDAWRTTSGNSTPFDFDKAESIRPKVCCIAVRVTSEDLDDGFKPTGGEVQELSFKSKPNSWAYFSIK